MGSNKNRCALVIAILGVVLLLLAGAGIALTIILCAISFCSYYGLSKAVKYEEARKDKLASAKKDYEDALKHLEVNPSSPPARKHALETGRCYAAELRLNGQTGLDELALSNDIQAACARATMGGLGVAGEVEALNKLFQKGVLTTEEFERGKTAFLGAGPDKARVAIELLENLASLKARGVLSESEFNVKKWEILSERLLPGPLRAAR